MECWRVGVMSEPITPSLHYSIAPALRRGQEFLPDAQFRILGKENFADENLVRSEIARGDGGGIIDVFRGIDQDRAGLVLEGMIVGPDGEDGLGGISEIN